MADPPARSVLAVTPALFSGTLDHECITASSKKGFLGLGDFGIVFLEKQKRSGAKLPAMAPRGLPFEAPTSHEDSQQGRTVAMGRRI